MGPYISLESAALPFPRAIFPLLKGSAYQNGIGAQEEAGKSKFFLFETFLLFYLYFFFTRTITRGAHDSNKCKLN